MNHFCLFKKPENVLKEFLLPLISQFAILFIMLYIHTPFTRIDTLIQEPAIVGGITTKPVLGRLIFVFLGFAAAILCGIFASITAKKDSEYLPFFLGIFGGTFLFQALGIDLWHFSVNGFNFIQLGSVSSLPLVVLTILFCIYAIKNHSFDWGIWCLILAFLCNWLGQFLMLGTYPFVQHIIDPRKWNVMVGVHFGAIASLLGIYLGLFSSKDRKARLLSSMVTYIGLAIIMISVLEG